MSNGEQEKNLIVDHGIKPGGWSASGPDVNPYGTGGRTGAGDGSGWSVGFGSSGGGFSGGFGGSSRKRAKKRAKARAAAVAAQQQQAAAAEQEASAQAAREQARIQHELAQAAYARQLEVLTQTHIAKRQEWDQAYAAKSRTLSAQLDAELTALRKAPTDYENGNDWGLYLISKEQTRTATLISTKTNELHARQSQLAAFDGHHPLSRTPTDYRQSLINRSANDMTALNHVNNSWEQAYLAAHEASLLTESIRQLTEQSHVLRIMRRYPSRTRQTSSSTYRGLAMEMSSPHPTRCLLDHPLNRWRLGPITN